MNPSIFSVPLNNVLLFHVDSNKSLRCGPRRSTTSSSRFKISEISTKIYRWRTEGAVACRLTCINRQHRQVPHTGMVQLSMQPVRTLTNASSTSSHKALLTKQAMEATMWCKGTMNASIAWISTATIRGRAADTRSNSSNRATMTLARVSLYTVPR